MSAVACAPAGSMSPPGSSARGPAGPNSTMMPVSLLIALLLAFGIEPAPAGVPQSDVDSRVLETCGGITLVATLAFGLGFWVVVSGFPFRLFDLEGSAGVTRSGPGF